MGGPHCRVSLCSCFSSYLTFSLLCCVWRRQETREVVDVGSHYVGVLLLNCKKLNQLRSPSNRKHFSIIKSLIFHIFFIWRWKYGDEWTDFFFKDINIFAVKWCESSSAWLWFSATCSCKVSGNYPRDLTPQNHCVHVFTLMRSGGEDRSTEMSLQAIYDFLPSAHSASFLFLFIFLTVNPDLLQHI